MRTRMVGLVLLIALPISLFGDFERLSYAAIGERSFETWTLLGKIRLVLAFILIYVATRIRLPTNLLPLHQTWPATHSR